MPGSHAGRSLRGCIMNTLLARYQTLPRSARWLIVFALFLGLYFGAIDPLLSMARNWNDQADRLQERTRSVASIAEAMDRTKAEIDRTMTSLGKLKPLSTASDPQAALEQRLTAVVRKTGVSEKRRSPKPAATITFPNLRTIGPDQPPKLDRVAVEWQIECDTLHLVDVLRDLEQATEVHSLSSVQVRKINESSRGSESDGMLSVTIVVETWYVPRGSSTGTSSANSSTALETRRAGGRS